MVVPFGNILGVLADVPTNKLTTFCLGKSCWPDSFFLPRQYETKSIKSCPPAGADVRNLLFSHAGRDVPLPVLEARRPERGGARGFKDRKQDREHPIDFTLSNGLVVFLV